jgi:hypothetical protein
LVFTIPIPKENPVSIRYQKFGGSPSKNWREPPTLRPPFEEKKEFPQNFSKKEFPQKLKNVFPPKFTVQQYRPKIPIPAVSDTG